MAQFDTGWYRFPANQATSSSTEMRRWPNVGLMLGQRRRHLAHSAQQKRNIGSLLHQCCRNWTSIRHQFSMCVIISPGKNDTWKMWFYCWASILDTGSQECQASVEFVSLLSQQERHIEQCFFDVGSALKTWPTNKKRLVKRENNIMITITAKTRWANAGSTL